MRPKTFKGKELDKMSRKELREAVDVLCQILDGERAAHADEREKIMNLLRNK